MSFCDEVLDVIEAVAAGEGASDARVAAHVATCASCAAALESARSLERLLRGRPVPRPPSQFTSRTLARVRRARWRSEQFVDAGFNIAVVAIVVAVTVGLWLLLHRTGFVAVSDDAINLMGSGAMTLIHRITPSLPLYLGARRHGARPLVVGRAGCCPLSVVIGSSYHLGGRSAGGGMLSSRGRESRPRVLRESGGTGRRAGLRIR